MRMPISEQGAVLSWQRKCDDGDGCDDETESGGGVKIIVTIVTTVTGSRGKSQGGIPAGGDCRKAIQPEPLDFRPTETLAGWGERPLAFPPCPTASDKV